MYLFICSYYRNNTNTTIYLGRFTSTCQDCCYTTKTVRKIIYIHIYILSIHCLITFLHSLIYQHNYIIHISRLAAIGVANRVATERNESSPGQQSIGYVVRGDHAISHQTRLLFCTTGVLLRHLQSKHALDCITHIVVDEVHERQLDTDVLLGILKDGLTNVPHLKVVLMSGE